MRAIKRSLLFILSILIIISSIGINLRSVNGETTKKVLVGFYAMDNFMEGGTEGVLQSGFTYELLSEVESYAHWEIEYVYGDFKDLYNKLKNGEITLLPNVINTEERKEEVLFYEDFEINAERYYVSTLAKNIDENSYSIESLNGKRLATVSSAYEEKIFDAWALENGISMEKVYTTSFNGAWLAVENGEADYILNINNTAPNNNFMSLFEVGNHGVFFAINKEREDIIDDLDLAFKSIDDVSPFLISNLRQKYLSSALSSFQLTQEEKNWLNEHYTLKVGYLKGDRPYVYENNGETTGIYVEITNLLLEKLFINDLNVEWHPYNGLDDLRSALTRGDIDLICPEYHSYSIAGKNGVIISEVVEDVPMGILFSNNIGIDHVKTIAAVKNRPGVNYALEYLPDATIIEYDSIEKIIEAVENGEVDAAIDHIYSLQDSIKNNESDYSLSPLGEACSICFATSKDNHELIMIINRGFHLVSDSEINIIELKHATKANEYDSLRSFFRKYRIPIVILLIVIFVIIIYTINRALTSSKLKKNLEEIRKKNEIIEESRKSLSLAKEEAFAASKAKSTFLFNMSHDIRTPMNAIIGFNNMALEHIDDKEKLIDYLDKVNLSSKHLLTIINDVLDMSRIESGKVKCEYEKIDILNAADELIDMVKESLSKDLTIKTDYSSIKHRYVLADHVHTERAITNIISNSIKYTPDGGTISYTIIEKDGSDDKHYSYDFIVEDNGIGMSEEFLEHVFEEFSRERTSTISGIQGTGLGMAITKKLVSILGGTIQIESKQGEGTKVTINLELEAVDSIEEKENPVEAVIDESIFLNKRILLVEDNDLNREIATAILNDSGMIVDSAQNGKEAFDIINDETSNKYDLILMDIQMPIMNGYEAAEAIRKIGNEYAKNIPIIAMTANAFEEDKQNAINSGMNDHLSKPIDVQKLHETIFKMLKSK